MMKIVIVGGGVSGMFSAISASKNQNNEIIILEKNEKLGKKLFITGKGRCNVSNACDKDSFFKNIVTNSKFLYSAFNNLSNFDLMKLIEENGCKLKTERGNRVFPASDKSSDIIKALKKAITKNNIKIKYNIEVKNITVDCDKNLSNSRFKVVTKNNDKIYCDKVIIATGGLSYNLTGSTGDGYKFAKDFGINITKTSPSLVPFNIYEVDECKNLQGLTLKNVAIKIFDEKNKKIYTDFGEMLFTHFGVSGPIILSASAYIKENKNYALSIDLKPALDTNILDMRLLREIDENKNKNLKTILMKLLPVSFADVFLSRIKEEIKNSNKNLFVLNSEEIENLKCRDINKIIRKIIVRLLKDFRFNIKSKRGFDEAIITQGGVDVKEINPKTMECKKVKDLYFVGEVLDVDALTGGFNIQIAASTGFTAGKTI